MEIFAVIDTNVLVSALLAKRTDSPPRLIMDYLFKGHFTPLYNEEIISEYKEVLSRPKFKFSEDLVAIVINGLKEAGISLERVQSHIDMPDPKDVVFYEVALAKESSFLVTGNIKHFPAKSFVVTPAEMIQIIETTLHLT